MAEGEGGVMKGSYKYKNSSFLRIENDLVDEVKSIFRNYLKVIIC